MFYEIGILFRYMSYLPIIFLTIGLILILIEEMLWGSCVFGISGVIFTIIGITLRVLVNDGGNPFIQAAVLLLMQSILAAIGFLIVFWLSRKGRINRSWLVQNDTAVSQDFSAGTVDYSYLIGEEGTAFSYLRPIGKAEINGKLYDVNAGSVFIEEGTKIKVSSVEGVRISVVKVKE